MTRFLDILFSADSRETDRIHGEKERGHEGNIVELAFIKRDFYRFYLGPFANEGIRTNSLLPMSNEKGEGTRLTKLFKVIHFTITISLCSSNITSLNIY